MMIAPLSNPPRHALVIALRYIGDVLLCTPLAHALRNRYPDCTVDMLVFEGTQGILQNNPDLREVITVPERADRATQIALVRRLWRRYDLVLITLPGDRPHIYGWAAAPTRYGFVPAKRGQAWWKRLLMRAPLVFDDKIHRVTEGERLARALGLGPARTVVPPTAMRPAGVPPPRLLRAEGIRFDPARPFAVVHPSPRWRYKQWHMEGWRALVNLLVARGLQVLVSGGPGENESRYLDEVLTGLPAVTRDALVRVQGLLSLGELADLLRGAALYVGPDTATTHLAAACGTPTLALYGPTDPRQWGPWPHKGLDRPWEKAFVRQRRGNVMLLQNLVGDCVPCQQEGCERHRNSRSDCLDTLSADTVLQAADALLAERGITHHRDVA